MKELTLAGAPVETAREALESCLEVEGDVTVLQGRNADGKKGVCFEVEEAGGGFSPYVLWLGDEHLEGLTASGGDPLAFFDSIGDAAKWLTNSGQSGRVPEKQTIALSRFLYLNAKETEKHAIQIVDQFLNDREQPARILVSKSQLAQALQGVGSSMPEKAAALWAEGLFMKLASTQPSPPLDWVETTKEVGYECYVSEFGPSTSMTISRSQGLQGYSVEMVASWDAPGLAEAEHLASLYGGVSFLKIA